MTKRDRLMLLWVRDFLDDAMSAADDPRFLKRAAAARRLIQRIALPGTVAS